MDSEAVVVAHSWLWSKLCLLQSISNTEVHQGKFVNEYRLLKACLGSVSVAEHSTRTSQPTLRVLLRPAEGQRIIAKAQDASVEKIAVAI